MGAGAQQTSQVVSADSQISQTVNQYPTDGPATQKA